MRIEPGEVLFIIALTGILVGAWWFDLRPDAQRHEQMLDQIEAKQAKLDKLQQATKQIGDLKSEIGDLEKAISLLQSRLPSEKEIDHVLREAWELAEANDLQTASIQTLQNPSDRIFTDQGSAHAEQPVSVQVRGSFSGLYGFLQELERRPRIMRIHEVTLTKADDGPEGHVEAEFVMSIFFERNSEDPS